MQNHQFQIQQQTLTASLQVDLLKGVEIRSVPRPYRVQDISTHTLSEHLTALLSQTPHGVLLIDEIIQDQYLANTALLQRYPCFVAKATEDFKSLDGVLEVVRFLDQQKVGRGSLLVALGGGIIQDVAAFAAGTYKRGVPWSYYPTTLLGQADSCIGSKAGINFVGAKNLLGLFSAPRQIFVHQKFLSTLPATDRLSGLGEIFRLCLTGGLAYLNLFQQEIDAAVAGDPHALQQLISAALAVKQAVIEADEFELDIRRAMNFGHSFGHALEALTQHQIPHGMAVTLGVLVESCLSVDRGLLPPARLALLQSVAAPLISSAAKDLLATVTLDDLLALLQRDKKTEGTTLKLALLVELGHIRFVDLPLDAATTPLLRAAISRTLAAL